MILKKLGEGAKAQLRACGAYVYVALLLTAEKLARESGRAKARTGGKMLAFPQIATPRSLVCGM